MVLFHTKLLICCAYQNVLFEGTSLCFTKLVISNLCHIEVDHKGDLEQLYLFQLILHNPGIHLHELQHKLQEAYGVRVRVSTICRTLKFMDYTRQVIRHVALQQSEAMRAKFMAEVSIYDPSMLIWVDESGCNRRNTIRKYGYGIRGICPVDHRILVQGTRYSAVPVMSVRGIHDLFLAEGSISGDRFEFFIRNYLLPVLMPFNGMNPLSVVIMDNASIHHIESNVNICYVICAKSGTLI